MMRHWGLIVIGVLLAIVLLALFGGRIYMLHLIRETRVLGVVVLVVLVAIFLRLVVSLLKERTRRVAWVRVACVTIGIGALSYVLLVSAPSDSRVSHRGTLRFDRTAYQMAGRFIALDMGEGTISSSIDDYWQGWLFRCDLSGILCENVGEFIMRESSYMRMQDGVLEVTALRNDRVTFSYTP